MSSTQTYIPAWADQAAARLIERFGEGPHVVVTGISPSGNIHVGNLREVLVAEAVARALRARVQEVFPAGKRDKAAGLLVLEGTIRKGLHARLTREDVIVSKTTISSLRRFKDDVAQVIAGLECGVLLADTNDIKAGDNLEVFEVEERARTL